MIKNINMSLIKYPKINLIINIGALLLLRILFMENIYAEEYTIQEEPKTSASAYVKEIVITIGVVILFATVIGIITSLGEPSTIAATIAAEPIIEPAITISVDDQIAALCHTSVETLLRLKENYPEVVKPLIKAILGPRPPENPGN